MKAILAVVTLALVALVVEEKARQIAGDTHDAYGEMVDRARGATATLSKKIQQKPLIALLIAGSRLSVGFCDTTRKSAAGCHCSARLNQDPIHRESVSMYFFGELEGRQEGWAARYWHRARELIDDESRSAYPRRSPGGTGTNGFKYKSLVADRPSPATARDIL